MSKRGCADKGPMGDEAAIYCFVCSAEWPKGIRREWIALEHGRVACCRECAYFYDLFKELNLLEPETKPKEKVETGI
jgi:hypothetical protein